MVVVFIFCMKWTRNYLNLSTDLPTVVFTVFHLSIQVFPVHFVLEHFIHIAHTVRIRIWQSGEGNNNSIQSRRQFHCTAPPVSKSSLDLSKICCCFSQTWRTDVFGQRQKKKCGKHPNFDTHLTHFEQQSDTPWIMKISSIESQSRPAYLSDQALMDLLSRVALTFSWWTVRDVPWCGSQEIDSHNSKDREVNWAGVSSVLHLNNKKQWCRKNGKDKQYSSTVPLFGRSILLKVSPPLWFFEGQTNRKVS